jgi:hypothetical protein
MSLVLTLSEGLWSEFSSHNQYQAFWWKVSSNEAPSGINSPADKRGVLTRTHKAHFTIAYVVGPTDLLLLLLQRTCYVHVCNR